MMFKKLHLITSGTTLNLRIFLFYTVKLSNTVAFVVDVQNNLYMGLENERRHIFGVGGGRRGGIREFDCKCSLT